MKKVDLLWRSSAAFCAVVLGSLAACTPASDSDPAEEAAASLARVAIVGVTVIDGTGAPARPGQTVVIEGTQIAAVVEDGTIDLQGATVVEGEGKFLTPALWDVHAHTFHQQAVLDLYLANGVGNLRDMGCDPDCTQGLVDYRDRLERGEETGPDVLVSGPNVDGQSPFGGYAGHVQVTTETAASVVADLQSKGSDFIKVRDWLTRDEYQATVEAAHSAGMPIDGHVATNVPMLDALRSGQRTIEHSGSVLGGLFLACSSREAELRAELQDAMARSLGGGVPYGAFIHALGASYLDRVHDSFDEAKVKALVDAFVASGTALVPTLVVQHPALRGSEPRFDGRRVLDDESMRYVPEDMLEAWKVDELGALLDDRDRAAGAEDYRMLSELVGRLHRAGVPILAGTDSALAGETRWIVPGFSLHDELLLLVEAGLSPLDAIAAATSVPARVLGREDTGSVEAGKRADLVLLSADPSVDIRNVASVDAVFSRGEYLDRAALDGRLERARGSARGIQFEE